jgi:hypothetical protein
MSYRQYAIDPSQLGAKCVHPQHTSLLFPPFNLHVLTQRLAYMYEDAWQFSFCLAHENLDLVNKHVSELCLVLDKEIRKALNIR